MFTAILVGRRPGFRLSVFGLERGVYEQIRRKITGVA
jgi:hypothetical protein